MAAVRRALPTTFYSSAHTHSHMHAAPDLSRLVWRDRERVCVVFGVVCDVRVCGVCLVGRCCGEGGRWGCANFENGVSFGRFSLLPHTLSLSIISRRGRGDKAVRVHAHLHQLGPKGFHLAFLLRCWGRRERVVSTGGRKQVERSLSSSHPHFFTWPRQIRRSFRPSSASCWAAATAASMRNVMVASSVVVAGGGAVVE